MNHLLINAQFNLMQPGFSSEMLYACLAEEQDGLLPKNCDYTKHVAELVYARMLWHQNDLVRLSNGTLVGVVRDSHSLSHECTRAVVLPDDREMTDAEFSEYVEVIREKNRLILLERKYGPFAAQRVENRRRMRTWDKRGWPGKRVQS